MQSACAGRPLCILFDVRLCGWPLDRNLLNCRLVAGQPLALRCFDCVTNCGSRKLSSIRFFCYAPRLRVEYVKGCAAANHEKAFSGRFDIGEGSQWAGKGEGLAFN